MPTALRPVLPARLRRLVLAPLVLSLSACGSGAPATLDDAGLGDPWLDDAAVDDGGIAPDGGAPDAGTAPTFLVTGATALLVRPAEQATLSLAIARDPGFDEALSIELSGVPTGVTTDLPADLSGSSIDLVFHAAAAADPGSTPVLVRISSGSAVREHLVDVVIPGAPNALDVDFGTDGVTTLPGVFGVRLIRTDARGRIVVAGQSMANGGRSVVVARLTADGLIDPEWSHGSPREVELGTDVRVTPTGLAVHPDGRVFVQAVASAVGTSRTHMITLDEAGELDPTFAPDGVADAGSVRAGGLVLIDDETLAAQLGTEIQWITVVAPALGRVERVATAPSGTELLRDEAGALYSTGDWGIGRTTAEGDPDPTFDMDGALTAICSASPLFSNTAAILPGRNLLVIGVVDTGVPGLSATLGLMLDATGRPVTAFGSGGCMDWDTTPLERADALEDGTALAIGGGRFPQHITRGGALDPAFPIAPSGPGASELGPSTGLRVVPLARTLVAVEHASGSELARVWR